MKSCVELSLILLADIARHFTLKTHHLKHTFLAGKILGICMEVEAKKQDFESAHKGL